MKATRVALLAALGMSLTTVSVYSLTPPGAFGKRGWEATAPAPSHADNLANPDEARIQAVARDARKRAAIKGLPALALERLDNAAEAFFSARSTSEVDMSGTTRGAISLGERASLDDDHVAMLEQLANPAFTPPAGDAALAERDLQQSYDDLMKCKKKAPPGFPGGIEAEGIKKTERSWIPYREAWISLVAEARPFAKREAWKAWLAEKRTKMLKDLAGGC
jgi:hypothetical protein